MHSASCCLFRLLVLCDPQGLSKARGSRQSSFPQPQGNWWKTGTEPGLLSGSLKQRGHNSSFLESNHWEPCT